MNHLTLTHTATETAAQHADEAENRFAGVLAIAGVALMAILALGPGVSTGGDLAIQVAFMR